jgi:hypothetical protein
VAADKAASKQLVCKTNAARVARIVGNTSKQPPVKWGLFFYCASVKTMLFWKVQLDRNNQGSHIHDLPPTHRVEP